MEQWTKIKGYPDYSISNFGSVRSDRYNKTLKPSASSNSYLYVNLIKDKKKKTTAVHKLVIEHFGEIQPGPNLVVDHLDCNKQNNKINNLEWVSISENTKRSYGNNDAKRVLAKDLKSKGMTIKQVADHIGMSCGFVQDAIHS